MSEGGVEQPDGRHLVDADRVDARRDHPSEVLVDTRRVVTVIARDRRHERAIRHAPDVQLVVTDAQEPARDARPLAVAGAGIGTTSGPLASDERLTLARQQRIAAREDRLVVHHAASTRHERRSGCGSW